jgi:hypothetical protein
MAGRDFVETSIDLAKFVSTLLIIGALIGAFVVFGGALVGDGAYEIRQGWICLGVAAFAYVFRRIYPPVWRYIWESFK